MKYSVSLIRFKITKIPRIKKCDIMVRPFKKYSPNDLEHLKHVELRILEDVIKLCNKHDLKYFMYGGSLIGAVRHEGFIPWDDDVDIAMRRKDYDKFLKIAKKELDEKYEIINSETHVDYPHPFTKVCLKGTIFGECWTNQVSFNIGIFIDIFPLEDASKNKVVRYLNAALFRFFYHLTINSILKIKTNSKVLNYIHRFLHYFLKIIPNSTRRIKNIQRSLEKHSYEDSEFLIENFNQAGIMFYDKNHFKNLKKVRFENLEVYIPEGYDHILTQIYGDYMKLPPEEKRYNHAPDVLDFGDY